MDLIPISTINDFVFCPRSIYWHSIYYSFDQKTYHSADQTCGKIRHENIDKGCYSTAWRYLQGLEVYSEGFGLVGKIDIYDRREKSLIERKAKVKNIYDGQKFQLYAQMSCLVEMGFGVEKMILRSLADNKNYEIPFPGPDESTCFIRVIRQMREYKPDADHRPKNLKKCARCIYNGLCL